MCLQECGHRTPRVMSAFLRQMSEERLLVPEEDIKLLSIVGQGQYHITNCFLLIFDNSLCSRYYLLYKMITFACLTGEFGVVYKGTLSGRTMGKTQLLLKL